jgi:hypothetical protein
MLMMRLEQSSEYRRDELPPDMHLFRSEIETFADEPLGSPLVPFDSWRIVQRFLASPWPEAGRSVKISVGAVLR